MSPFSLLQSMKITIIEPKISVEEALKQVEENQPTPNHYDDTPQGEAEFWEDYWQGDIQAWAYHEAMGDR